MSDYSALCMAVGRFLRAWDDMDTAIAEELNGFGDLEDAVAELRPFARSGEVLEALRAMVLAQHAGPITDEMYDAWERARAVLQSIDVTPGSPG